MAMAKQDKLKVANYLRALCLKIMQREWPESQLKYVHERVRHFTRTACKLEAETSDTSGR